MPVLNNVTFLYTKIARAELMYESKDRHEYSVDVAISKEQAKHWDKKYSKQKHKRIDNEDFIKIFKIDPPFPDQDEQYVVKLKKKAEYVDKDSGAIKPIPDQYRPRVFTKGEDGKLKDITTTLISNGSKGAAQFDENTNSYGTFAQLKALRVDELIEYQAAGSSYDELGEVGELQDLTESVEEAPKATKKVESDDFDDFDDDSSIPF